MGQKIKKLIKNYLPVIIMLVLAVIAGIIVFTKHITFDDIKTYVIDNETKAIVIILALYAIKSVTGIVFYSLLAALSGFVFKFPLAITINSLGTIICMTISYLIGYYTSSESIIEKTESNPKIKKYFEKIETNSFLVSYLLHAMGISTEALGVAFGIAKMPYIKYIISSFIAVLPGMICVTLFGKEPDITSPAFLFTLAVKLSIMAVAYVYSSKKLIKRRNTEKQN